MFLAATFVHNLDLVCLWKCGRLHKVIWKQAESPSWWKTHL